MILRDFLKFSVFLIVFINKLLKLANTFPYVYSRSEITSISAIHNLGDLKKFQI